MATEQELIIRILVSVLAGTLLGLERELRKSPAGTKTHTLDCLGATLFTISSLTIGEGADISRIAAQVAVGIGFIGGGVIFKVKDKVIGLTTAADLWVGAAIGLLIGIGQLLLAFVALAAVLTLLLVGATVERRIFHK